MGLFDKLKPDTDAPKSLPEVPPPGSDRATWIRFAIQVALLLAAIFFGGSKIVEVQKDVQEVKVQLAK